MHARHLFTPAHATGALGAAAAPAVATTTVGFRADGRVLYVHGDEWENHVHGSGIDAAQSNTIRDPLSTKAGRRIRSHLSILAAVLAGCVLAPVGTAAAQCVPPLRDGSFEEQRSSVLRNPWVAEGRAGIEIRSRRNWFGANSAWAGTTAGWNGIRQVVRLHKGTLYTLKAYVRTSDNVRDGYIGFRNPSQRPVSELRFGNDENLRQSHLWRELRVRFRPAKTRKYYVFAGFWAPGQDSWIRVDHVRVQASCNDVVLNPVDD